MSLINKPIILHFHDADEAGSFPIAVGKLMSEYRKKLKRSMRGVKIFDAYDPSESRDPSGKWTAGGGSSGKSSEAKYQTTSFVSPNEDPNNLSFEQAHEGLKSPRQKILAGISHQIDTHLGIKDVRINNVIGAWADGAENSVMTNSLATDPDIEEAAAAMKAYLANQKAVLLFHPDEEGHQFLAQFRVKSNNLAEIHKTLLQSDVHFHTLEPRGDDTIVHFYGESEADVRLFDKAATQFDAKVQVESGHGKFIPPEVKQDGSDAEQREFSRKAYQQAIQRVEATGKLGEGFQAQWQNHIDNWERETGERIGGRQQSSDRYDPSESRDPAGKWTAGGGTAEQSATESAQSESSEYGGTGERGGRESRGIQSGRNRSVEEAQGEAKASAAGRSHLVGLPDRPISLHSGDHYVPGPIAKVHEVAEQYMKSAGLPYNPPHTYAPVDKARATEIAHAFANMKHDPNDPKVKASYQALAKETIAQWHAVKASGLKVEWIKPDQEDPYAETPRKAAIDVQRNNHWWGFPTDQGFGSGEEAEAAKRDNPLLEDSGEVIDGRKCCVNDIFRIVHDYFGHFKEGVGFRASGEENAWRSHASMYSKEALPAVTSETRGQNSWVNFGPYGETNKKASAGDTHYAPQKIGLMPEWTYNEGREDEDMPNKTKDRRWKDVIIHTLDGVFRFSLNDAEFKREEHPFAPAGTPGSKGGQFVSKGAGATAKAAQAPKATKAQQQRANTPPKRTTKPTSVKVRQDNGSLSDVELPQDVVAHARTLKEAPDKYFKTETPGTEMIPVEKLVQTRARPEGIAHAVELMAKAYQGEGGKRGPIHVQKLDDGNYLVLDGNSTTTIATAAGWEHLPALVIPDASYLPKKEPKHAGEREAAERAIAPPEAKPGKPKATKPAKPPAPTQSSTTPLKGAKGHPGLISPAGPKGKGDEFHQPSVALIKTDPRQYAGQIQTYKENPAAYPLTEDELSGDDDQVARNVIEHIKSNLKYIYDKTSTTDRASTKEWYKGARKMVDEHVKKYKEFGLKDTTVAGVYACLSPTNLWDQNVRQGDQMIDIYLKHRHEPWDKLMDDAVKNTENPSVKRAMQDIQGKKYDELDTDEKKGMWIRVYDEGHSVNNPEYKEHGFQPFAKITPEGKREGWYTKPVNVNEYQSFSWQSAPMMAKAVKILESNGDPAVISTALRPKKLEEPPQHKVRSFYNNILDPDSANEDVTMDTHAVDAAWFMDDPIAVYHNFGNIPQKKGRPTRWVKGTPGSVATGASGNYGFNADAYREAAHELGIKPRELQSVVWSTKRVWMENMSEESHQRMRDTWEDYRLGLLTQKEAQDECKSIIDEDLAMTSTQKKRLAAALSSRSQQNKAEHPEEEYVPNG